MRPRDRGITGARRASEPTTAGCGGASARVREADGPRDA
jgi:hypothetical protein